MQENISFGDPKPFLSPRRAPGKNAVFWIADQHGLPGAAGGFGDGSRTDSFGLPTTTWTVTVSPRSTSCGAVSMDAKIGSPGRMARSGLAPRGQVDGIERLGAERKSRTGAKDELIAASMSSPD